ncbi:MAG: hypothetical protein JKY95_14980 [Planctomycetaceae bacterium]|nr:hypothetical protein [Planctomycetaceae bacterium]
MSDSGQKQSLSQSITNDFRATASLESLRQRASILSEIRTFFHQRQYWEAETPLLSAESVIDWHLEPFSVSMAAHCENQRYLQTSPELAMKRLLAGGADRIYQICKAFRKEEQGPLHNPEFTILEWYACGLNDHQQMDFTEEMIQHLFLQFKQSLPGPLLRITYEQAFHDALGVSILDLDAQELKGLAQQHGISFATESPDETQPGERDLWLNLLLAEKVEPFLKTQHAVFLYNYPAS